MGADGVQRSPVESRAIVSAGYDPKTRTLELEWKNGRVYQYLDVPEGTYAWLLRAPSKGAFFARMIDERYAFREVTPADPKTERDLAEALEASLREVDDR
jgi:hypothetical protein